MNERTRLGGSSIWLLLSLALSAAGVAGSLGLTMALGLQACPLCFYQRSFAMAVFAILAVGLAVKRPLGAMPGLLALPLATAGFGVAAFHEYLVVSGALECPAGLLGLGTAPAQSLVLFVLLLLTLGLACLRESEPGLRPGHLAATSLLGLMLAGGAVASAPPLPPAPAAPYDPVEQPLKMCRPPYGEST